MHVLWVNESARPIGGCERYVLEMASLLRERGVRSSLLYAVPGWTEPAFTRGFEQAYPMVDLERQVRAIAPDVLYVHSLRDSRAMAALAGSGVPALRFFHDHRLFCLREHKYTTLGRHTCTRTVGAGCYPCLGFVNRSESWPGLRLRSVSGLLAEQRASMGLAGYVVASRYMADHVARHGFDPDRIHVNPLFAREPVEKPARPERENDLLLFAGQLLRGKAVDVLFDALARVDVPWRLVLVGTGRQEAELRELCARRGLGDRVTFAGRVPADELDDLYDRAACVVAPSRTPETFGLIGPEAMSHATPVVATAVGGVGEWLRDGVNGLAVPPDDVAALAAALSRVLADPKLARTLGEAGRRDYLERFRPDAHVTRLLALLQSVAAPGRAALP